MRLFLHALSTGAVVASLALVGGCVNKTEEVFESGAQKTKSAAQSETATSSTSQSAEVATDSAMVGTWVLAGITQEGVVLNEEEFQIVDERDLYEQVGFFLELRENGTASLVFDKEQLVGTWTSNGPDASVMHWVGGDFPATLEGDMMVMIPPADVAGNQVWNFKRYTPEG